jgi:hypothetical protein
MVIGYGILSTVVTKYQNKHYIDYDDIGVTE